MRFFCNPPTPTPMKQAQDAIDNGSVELFSTLLNTHPELATASYKTHPDFDLTETLLHRVARQGNKNFFFSPRPADEQYLTMAEILLEKGASRTVQGKKLYQGAEFVLSSIISGTPYNFAHSDQMKKLLSHEVALRPIAAAEKPPIEAMRCTTPPAPDRKPQAELFHTPVKPRNPQTPHLRQRHRGPSSRKAGVSEAY